jgi:hypothetical protein
MFVLEYKVLYIVPEPLTKNRTCQSYRWKQYAMCKEEEPLQKIIDADKHSEDWRIIHTGGKGKANHESE